MIIRLTKKTKTLFKPHLHSSLRIRTLSLIALLLIGGLFSNGAYAQQSSKISINAKNLNLKDVISQIEKQTEYLFVYTPSEINLVKSI